MKNYDISGKTFGNWEVLCKDIPRPGCRNSFWICRCVCGTVRSVNRSTLVSGRSSSCGCVQSENRKGINRTHGMSKSRLYHEWASMKRRCSNPKDKSACSYFGKGITVCEEWISDFTAFRDWALSNGYADDLTLDRIDNNAGYSPNNCRWVSNADQQQNKTTTVYIDYAGKRWCLRTLCEHIGFPYKLAHRRYTRAVKAGKVVSADLILAPVHAEKIAYKYRNHSGDQ